MGAKVNGRIGGTNVGETPYWEVDWGVSWWQYSVAGTFPSAVTSNQYNPAPNCGGSMFVNDVGTATRAGAKVDYRSLTVEIGLGVTPLVGPGGASQYQTIIGAKRVPSTIKVTYTKDAGAASATPAADTAFLATTPKHMLVTLSPVAGASLSFYCPNVCITGARPVQQIADRINRETVEMMAYTSANTTSELTLSAIRFFYS